MESFLHFNMPCPTMTCFFLQEIYLLFVTYIKVFQYSSVGPTNIQYSNIY